MIFFYKESKSNKKNLAVGGGGKRGWVCGYVKLFFFSESKSEKKIVLFLKGGGGG